MKIVVKTKNGSELTIDISEDTNLNGMRDVFKTILTFLTFGGPFKFLDIEENE